MSHSRSTRSYREILSLSWPILLEMGAQTLIMNMVVYMISRLGDAAVASVSSSNAILGVVSQVLGIIATGSTILVAQYHGAGDKRTTSQMMIDSVRANLIVSVVISGILFAIPDVFMHLINVPQDIWVSTRYFFRMMSLLGILQSFMMIAAGILRSLGRTKVVMYFTVVGVLITVLLNALFIYGLFGIPKLGLTGIVLSNAIGSLIGSVAMFVCFVRALPVRPTLRSVLNSWSFTKKIVWVGLPSAAEFGSFQMTQFIIAAFVALLGTAAISIRQYAGVVESVSFLLGFGVAQGVSILVSQRVGRNSYDEARSISLDGVVLSVCVMAAMSVLLFLFGEDMIRLFSSNPDVIRAGGNVLKIIAVAQPAKGINMVVGGALRGAGDNKWLMWNSGTFVWLSVLTAYLFGFSFGLGLYGIWWGMVLDEWVRAFLVSRRLIRNKWQGKSYVLSEQSVCESGDDLRIG